MAVDLNGTTGEITRDAASQPVESGPMTFACWFSKDVLGSASAGGCMMFLGDKDVTNNYWQLTATTTDKVGLNGRNTTTTSSVLTGNTYSAATWQHAVGIVSDTVTNCISVLNGDWANRGTGTQDNPSTAIDRFTLGARNTSAPTLFFDGKLAEAAMWNVALAQADVEALADGFSPLMVRPSALVLYLPLWGSNRDLKDSTRTYTNTGTPTFNQPHPRIIYPWAQSGVFKIAAAATGWGPLIGQRRNRLAA